MSTVIFLGAGASAADGAPIQSALFQEYFSSNKFMSSDEEMDRELTTFFDEVFGVDVHGSSIPSISFPTFEEALGLLDLAELRRESLKGYDLDSIVSNSNRLRFLRIYLTMAMAQVIAEKLNGGASTNYHVELIQKLSAQGLLQSTTFISANYDILIDNALESLPNPRRNVDYAVPFDNSITPPGLVGSHATRLLKVHGSLNWLYCRTCSNLALTPGVKGALDLLPCERCESLMTPIIVPPTFYKDMSNVFLNSIWNSAESILREVDHVIFCGYSLPDADMHIKYMIKRSEINRSHPLRVSVINNHARKTSEERKQERFRYERFFRCSVDYRLNSFEEFAASPGTYY